MDIFTRSLKQDKGDNRTRTALYHGIVPYITNFYAFFNRYSKEKFFNRYSKEKFFNRYSKEKTTLVKLVRTFLFFNFFSGFYVIFLFTRFLDTGNGNFSINISMVILFLSMLFFWLMNLMTSFKIRNEIVKWEKLFPKLEEWAQELEQLSSEKSNFFEEEALL